MRRVTWLVLIGAVCVGCAKKDEVPLPNVALDAPDRGRAVSLAKPNSAVFALKYAELWDPAGAEKKEPAEAMKLALAERYFSEHQTEFLAPATVGSAVNIAQGGLHGIATPVVLAAVYPSVAKKLKDEWPQRLASVATVTLSGASSDLTSTVGSSTTRILVFRVKTATDDELRTRYGGYLTRLEDAVKGRGATVSAHQRGGARPLGEISDIRYETETRVGYVRSVILRNYDKGDPEVASLMLGDADKQRIGDLARSSMQGEKGPYLLVALKEQSR